MEDKNEALVIRSLMMIAVVMIGTIVGFVRHRGIQVDEPLAFGISCSLFLLFLLWEWRNNKFEFIKRFALAVPLAIVPAIVGSIVGDIKLSVSAGILTILFLLLKTDYWKRHCLITLTVALIFTFLLASIQQELVKRENWNLYKVNIIFVLGLIIGSFYAASLAAINSTNLKAAHPVAIKLLIFVGLSFLACALVLINHIVCTRCHISFAVSFGISVLIALAFWWACRLLKISNIALPDTAQTAAKRPIRPDECECCGKTGIPQELLFKISSGQRVCAVCLKEMEQQRTI